MSNDLSNEEYLERKLRCLIEPLVTSLLMEKPQEPVSNKPFIFKILFMIDWLQNFSGIGNISEVNTERAELHFLRKEMKKYAKRFKTEEDANHSEQSNDEEEDDQFEEELQQRKAKVLTKGQRVSVSAEVYGSFNKKKEFVARVIPKSNEQKQRISETLAKSILFNTLEDKEKETVLMAFSEQRFQNGDVVINQGDQGDVLFLIESGYFECFKKFVRYILKIKE